MPIRTVNLDLAKSGCPIDMEACGGEHDKNDEQQSVLTPYRVRQALRQRAHGTDGQQGAPTLNEKGSRRLPVNFARPRSAGRDLSRPGSTPVLR
jgi:hypothetical protein